jgi:hypothetical protein
MQPYNHFTTHATLIDSAKIRRKYLNFTTLCFRIALTSWGDGEEFSSMNISCEYSSLHHPHIEELYQQLGMGAQVSFSGLLRVGSMQKDSRTIKWMMCDVKLLGVLKAVQNLPQSP